MLKEKNIPQKVIQSLCRILRARDKPRIHSSGGRIMFTLNDEKIVIETKDEGPGIEDVSLVLQGRAFHRKRMDPFTQLRCRKCLSNTRRVSDLDMANPNSAKGPM